MADTDPATVSIREALSRKALASARHRAAVARLLRIGDNEMLALLHLGRAGQLTPGALGQLLGLTSGGTTAMVQRLERAGHVVREPHPVDRRSTLLRLSPETERRAVELIEPLVAGIDAAIAALSRSERETVERFLQAVARLTEDHAQAQHERAIGQQGIGYGEPVPALWA